MENQWTWLCSIGVDSEPLAGHEGLRISAHLPDRIEYQSIGAHPVEAADAFLVRQLIDLDDPEIGRAHRSEEHTSELQSLMRISYAVFCLKKQSTPRSSAKHNSIVITT